MSARYENFGVRFLYPENWGIVDEDASNWPRTVTVQSPDSGFWALHVYSPAQENVDLASDLLKSMRTEYEEIETETITETINDVEFVGYDLNWYCLDFIVTAQIRSFTIGDNSYLVLCQAESREFDELLQVFKAITHTLIEHSAR